MSNYFETFPLCDYRFGDNKDTVLFPNIASYVDILDTTKNSAAFYQKQYIQEYERPDTMSHKLYGTAEYYWTFFYMNDHIRRSGWPVSYNELQVLAKEAWPHQTARVYEDISNIFPVGTKVTGGPRNDIPGTILSRNLDLGQIVIQSTGDTKFPTSGKICYLQGGVVIELALVKVVDQYLSIHHYEDEFGNFADINPHENDSTIPGLWTSKTYFGQMTEKNDSLKVINALSKDSVGQVVGQWKKYMNRQVGV